MLDIGDISVPWWAPFAVCIALAPLGLLLAYAGLKLAEWKERRDRVR